MALKACRECGKSVSTEAGTCPHCGVKTPTKLPGSAAIKYGIGALFILLVTGVVAYSTKDVDLSSPPPDSRPKQVPVVDEDTRRGYQAAAVAKNLKAMMRNPASFELAQVIAMPKDVTCITYRSQNGFGGLNVEHAYADAHLIHTEEELGFNVQWNRRCTAKAGKDETTYTKYVLK